MKISSQQSIWNKYKTVNLISIMFLFICLSCNSNNKSNKENKTQIEDDQIICTDDFCQGAYYGKEFINGSDIAHQFSNTMSSVVGDKLKALYDVQNYSKVDFSKITMTTIGMGTGIVQYELNIPFKRVESKCESFTSFDHVGGWNHAPELEKRKKQLNDLLLKGDKLNISKLKETNEGLQEYWIQWRNIDKQKDCMN